MINIETGAVAFTPFTGQIADEDQAIHAYQDKPSYEYPEPTESESDCQFFRQHQATMTELAQWGKVNTNVDPKDINAQLEKYNKKFRRKGLGTCLKTERYSELKKYFEDILQLLQSGPKPLQAKISIYQKMLKQLNVCPPGMYSSIQEIESQLKQIDSVEYWLATSRTTIIKQLAEQFTATHYSASQGMAVHVTSAFIEKATTLDFAPIGESKVEDTYKEDILNRHQDGIITMLTSKFQHEYNAQAVYQSILCGLCEAIFTKIETLQKTS